MSWNLEIHHIDVLGTGDATLIVAREQGGLGHVQSALIDGGRAKHADIVHNYLCKELKKGPASKSYHPLNVMVATHYDIDHVGGLSRLLSMTGTGLYTSSRLYDQGEMTLALDTPEAKTEHGCYLNYRDEINKVKSRKRCSADKTNLVGEDILWGGNPPAGAPQIVCVAANCRVITGYDKTGQPIIEEVVTSMAKASSNERSLAFLVCFHNFKYYVGGDIEKVQENALRTGLNATDTAQGRIIALKTSHHGANTATSRLFVNRLRPEAAFISCGTENMYDHPALETMNVLDGYEALAYPVDPNGTHPAMPPDSPYSPVAHYMTGFQNPDAREHLGGNEAIVAGDSTTKQPGHIVLRVTEQQASHTPMTGRVFASVKVAIEQAAAAMKIDGKTAEAVGAMAAEVAMVTNSAATSAATAFALDTGKADLAHAAIIGAHAGAASLVLALTDMSEAVLGTVDTTLTAHARLQSKAPAEDQIAKDIEDRARETFRQALKECLERTATEKLIDEKECIEAVEKVLDSDELKPQVQRAVIRSSLVVTAITNSVKAAKVVKMETLSADLIDELEEMGIPKSAEKAWLLLVEASSGIDKESAKVQQALKKLQRALKAKNSGKMADDVNTASASFAGAVAELERIRANEETMKQSIKAIQKTPVGKRIAPEHAHYLKQIENFQMLLEKAATTTQGAQAAVAKYTKAVAEAKRQIAQTLEMIVAPFLLPIAARAGKDACAADPRIGLVNYAIAMATGTAIATGANVALAAQANSDQVKAAAQACIDVLAKEDEPVPIASYTASMEAAVMAGIDVVTAQGNKHDSTCDERAIQIVKCVAGNPQRTCAAIAAASVIVRGESTGIEAVVMGALKAASLKKQEAAKCGAAVKARVDTEEGDSAFTVEFYDVFADPRPGKASINHW